MYTSAPRTLSMIWIWHSPSLNLEILARVSGTPRRAAISSHSPRFAEPAISLISWRSPPPSRLLICLYSSSTVLSRSERNASCSSRRSKSAERPPGGADGSILSAFFMIFEKPCPLSHT